jgi:chromosomal replication initiator protein
MLIEWMIIKMKHDNIKATFTFETFIVGDFNREAHDAVLAASSCTAYSHNPLLICGKTGLGKTHLLWAIANRVKHVFPNKRVFYTTGEHFSHSLITSIKQNQAVEFRALCAAIDLLLIDNIEFICGKEQTQEEFSYCFEKLRDEGKQVIVCASRRSSDNENEMDALFIRLVFKFSSGCVIEITQPDEETVTAILERESEFLQLAMPKEASAFISERYHWSNVMEVKGALTRILACSNTESKKITPSNIEDWLRYFAR